MNLDTLEKPTRIVSLARLGLLWYETYFGAQKGVNVDAATVTEAEIDKRIIPDEQAIYPYLFAILYLSYSGLFMLSNLAKERYQRASEAFGSVIAEAERIFLSQPSKMVTRAGNLHPLTLFLQGIDGPTNCYPSLHVAFAVLAYQIIKETPATDPRFASAMRRSCIDLCRSTMRIRQHSVIDVIGGYALAERTYRQFMSDHFEDLLAEIFPEFVAAELSAVGGAMTGWSDLSELLARLFVLFPKLEIPESKQRAGA